MKSNMNRTESKPWSYDRNRDHTIQLPFI